ncbi:MAG: hypothetical protein ACT4PT_03120 [Methanobacteriota archaeon]
MARADAPPRPDPGPGLIVATGALLAATGLLLLVPYEPSAPGAHASILAIEAGPYRRVRSVHAAAATALVVLVAVRLVGLVREGDARRGRSVAALALVAGALAAFFSGGLLPWDQQAYESAVHLYSGVGLAVGSLSGPDPDSFPLLAAFALHLLFGVLVLIATVERTKGERGTERTHSVLLSLLSALSVVAYAIAFPPETGPRPIPGLSLAGPDWPFVWLVPLQDAVGPVALLALPAAFVAAAVLLWSRRSRPALLGGH